MTPNPDHIAKVKLLLESGREDNINLAEQLMVGLSIPPAVLGRVDLGIWNTYEAADDTTVETFIEHIREQTRWRGGGLMSQVSAANQYAATPLSEEMIANFVAQIEKGRDYQREYVVFGSGYGHEIHKIIEKEFEIKYPNTPGEAFQQGPE